MKTPLQATSTLYLLPVTLGDTAVEEVIPEGNLILIRKLKYFIVEDLRSARRFLRKAGFEGDLDTERFQILNEHTNQSDYPQLIAWIKSVGNCGLLSESGLPCIADPGSLLVQYARDAGIQVKALSGPSSLFLALMASGFNGQQFCFNGYLPIEKKARVQAIKEIERHTINGRGTQIFIEAPYRNDQILQDILKTCSPGTMLCIAMDLTTSQEWVHTASISTWKKRLPSLNKRQVVFLLSQ